MSTSPARGTSANDKMASALASFDGFSDAEVNAICASLPPGSKHGELSEILAAWTRIAVPDHLLHEPYTESKKRNARLKAVAQASKSLNAALASLSETDVAMIVNQMADERGRRSYDAMRAERSRLQDQLFDLRDHLPVLSQAATDLQVPIRHHNPPNRTAFLVHSDFAAIFSYVSGLPATRRTVSGREGEGEDTGPFFKFLCAVWPPLFGDGDTGLSAALKKWATYSKAKGGGSYFIDNFLMSRPRT